MRMRSNGLPASPPCAHQGRRELAVTGPSWAVWRREHFPLHPGCTPETEAPFTETPALRGGHGTKHRACPGRSSTSLKGADFSLQEFQTARVRQSPRKGLREQRPSVFVFEDAGLGGAAGPGPGRVSAAGADGVVSGLPGSGRAPALSAPMPPPSPELTRGAG